MPFHQGFCFPAFQPRCNSPPRQADGEQVHRRVKRLAVDNSVVSETVSSNLYLVAIICWTRVMLDSDPMLNPDAESVVGLFKGFRPWDAS